MTLLTAEEITYNKGKPSLDEVLHQIDTKLVREAKQHRFKMGRLGIGSRIELPSWMFEEMLNDIQASLELRGFTTRKETKEIGTKRILRYYLHIFW